MGIGLNGTRFSRRRHLNIQDGLIGRLDGGLALAAALTVAWDSFIGYEFFRFLELVL